MMGLVQALPVMLLAIAGGQLADRFDRRRVIMATLALGTLSSAGLLAVALLGRLTCRGSICCLASARSARRWAVPRARRCCRSSCPPNIFSNAVTWNSTVFYIASVTGPVVGGVIMMSMSGRRIQRRRSRVVVACRLLAVGGDRP